MNEHTVHVRCVVDQARLVLEHLASELTRLLDQSWRGEAAGEALEAVRRCVSDAVDGFAGAQAAATPSPPSTAPAGYFGDSASAMPSSPTMHRNRFDDVAATVPTHPTGGGSLVPATGTLRASDNPLPAASLNAATTPTTPPSTPAPATQVRGGIPYTPLMGTAYPGAMGRGDGGTRRTPGFLISIDHANELIGPLPKVSPPVLGRR